MQTFFSGTDMSELHENAPNYPFYLSLIVNFSGEYTAKVASVVEVESKWKILGKNVFSSGKRLMIVDLNIEKEAIVDESFVNKVSALVTKKKEADKKVKAFSPDFKDLPWEKYSKPSFSFKSSNTPSDIADMEVREFLCQLLTFDPLAKDDLYTILKKLPEQYKTEEQQEKYMDELLLYFDSIAVSVFQRELTLAEQEVLAYKSVKILSPYKDSNVIVNQIVEEIFVGDMDDEAIREYEALNKLSV